MDQAELYSNYNKHQRIDTEYYLNEYLNFMKWNANGDETVMDIGSGSGNITSTILLPKLPKQLRKLVGIDICDNMVNFATENFKPPKVEYCQADIGSKQLNPNWLGRFDHLFSFYCLHWVPDQKQTVQNMYDLLRPGGDILLILLVYAPIVEVYEKLRKSPKWEKYMTEAETYINFYKQWKDIEHVKNILNNVGFSIQICKYKDRTHTYENIDVFREFAKSVNAFVSKLPKDLQEDYMNDVVNEMKPLITFDDNKESIAQVILPSKVIIVVASKKSN